MATEDLFVKDLDFEYVESEKFVKKDGTYKKLLKPVLITEYGKMGLIMDKNQLKLLSERIKKHLENGTL